MALGSAKMNLPATKSARIYKKPGVYLGERVLRVGWRSAADAELAIAPSALASILDIDLPIYLGPERSFRLSPGDPFHASG
jgi:hypothetical protein